MASCETRTAVRPGILDGAMMAIRSAGGQRVPVMTARFGSGMARVEQRVLHFDIG